MNPVKVRDLEIGSGKPKIIVPIVGVTKEDIVNEARTFGDLPLDVVEWRVDWFEGSDDFSQVKEVLEGLREALGNTPILMTFRTSKEGGEKPIEMADYIALNVNAAKTGLVDLVDVEAFSGDDVVREIIEGAHANNVKVVASNHDFHKTPSKSDIVYRLRKMQDLGADIPKIAVMPQSTKDVLTLLAATEEMASDFADRPIITMSMGPKGVISRLAGEAFGSSMTFGAAKKASAPGQMGVLDLDVVLEDIHNAM
ncbi:type I 3-dehydroquinate dehydratase [Erysipelotrichaceae bacterium 51-3]